MEIRSYRRVFDLERRVYRIDRLRLNPGGVPLRGLVYLLVIVLVSVAVSSLPVIGAAADLFPWWVRDLAGPAVGAGVLGAIRLDGRALHVGAGARLRYFLGSHGLSRWPLASNSGRWAPAPIVLLPDGSDGTFRRLQYTGPGAVRVSHAHVRESTVPETGSRAMTVARSPGLVTIRPLTDVSAAPGPQVIVLTDGARLRVNPSARTHSRR